MSIKINAEENYYLEESNGESYRWQDRNPPKIKQEYQPTRMRQNPPRYPNRGQTIDNKYK